MKLVSRKCALKGCRSPVWRTLPTSPNWHCCKQHAREDGVSFETDTESETNQEEPENGKKKSSGSARRRPWF